MTINLKFVKNDFKDFRSFEKAILKQLGKNCYVGTNNICLYFDYPPELSAMLRPFPPQKQLEFTLNNEMGS